MQKWEYLSLTRVVLRKGPILSMHDEWQWADDSKNGLSLVERLNHLGEQGWELIAALPIARENGESSAGMTSGFVLMLKRPK